MKQIKPPLPSRPSFLDLTLRQTFKIMIDFVFPIVGIIAAIKFIMSIDF